MKSRICCLLLSALLTAAAFCIPALAEETRQTETVCVDAACEESVPTGTVAETACETEPAEVFFSTMALERQPQIAVIPIAQVRELFEGTRGVSFGGTVVLVNDSALVVQDDSGGIRLRPPESPAVSVGDVLLITGDITQEFCISEVTIEDHVDHADLPAVETALASAPAELRILVKDGTLHDGKLTQGDNSIEVCTDAFLEGSADIFGVILDGILYADSIVPVSPPAPPERPRRDWNVYFGLLDAHTDISDGDGSVWEAFSCAANVQGLDFFAVTDHSDSFDNADSGCITVDGNTVSSDWAAGKQAAAAVTNEDFVGIFGYEMTWGEDKSLGHINTFHTPGWQTREQPGFETLEGYYRALQQVPEAVSQFNHPGLAYGEFGNFTGYDPAFDAVMQLLQVEGENGESFYPYYILALDKGWHVAPTVGQDNHHGAWGNAGSSRTAVLAQSLTEKDLYHAMGSRRVYATQDSDLYVDYRLNGHSMGAIIGVTDSLEVSVVLDDPTDESIGIVEVISSGGRVLASRKLDEPYGKMTFPVATGSPYYFLRIIQPDGDVAVTAPVWVDDFTDMGIRDFSADTNCPIIGQTVNLALELFNREVEPFEVKRVVLLRGEQKIGDFTADGAMRYTYPLLWEEPGEVRLTAVVRGTVDGRERSYQRELILHFRDPAVKSASIRQVRSGTIGTSFEIEGYATSGNTNVYTTFPDTIYVQDNTGGIPVMGDFPQEIQVGTPLRVAGVLRERDRERYLDLIDCQVRSVPMYRYAPPVLGCGAAMNYTERGGSLVQTEGTLEEMILTRDRQGVSRLTLRDGRGDIARVIIEPEIRSGAYGINRLATQFGVGDAVRAIGLLHRKPDGTVALRVRNCDEVVYVPPIPDRSNHQTGDWLLCIFLRILPGNWGKWLH